MLSPSRSVFGTTRLSQSSQLRFPDRQLECTRNRSQWESKHFKHVMHQTSHFPLTGNCPTASDIANLYVRFLTGDERDVRAAICIKAPEHRILEVRQYASSISPLLFGPVLFACVSAAARVDLRAAVATFLSPSIFRPHAEAKPMGSSCQNHKPQKITSR